MHVRTRTSFRMVFAAGAALAILTACQSQAQPTGQHTAAQGLEKEPDRGPAENLGESLAPDKRNVVEPPPAVASALLIIQKQIIDYVAKGTTYTFASYVDPATGKIVLDTDAPAEVIFALTDLPNAAKEEREAAKQKQVNQTTLVDIWNRRDDVPAFWGGGGIASGTTGCSSGYAVQNAAGTRFMVTAGHCFPNGATVMTESGASTYGTVSSRRLTSVTGDLMDAELIGGRTYGRRVYRGDVTSTVGGTVVSAGTAYVGYSAYCHSGRTTGEQCGHTVTSINGLVCTVTGCKFPVISFSGGTIPMRGDSGGPFYATNSTGNMWIRGHVIAGGGTTGFVQPWVVLAPALGLTIVTS